MKNSLSVIFAKPHVLSADELFAHLYKLVRAHGFQVQAHTTRHLDSSLFFLNYLPHAYFASQPVADHFPHIEPNGVARIEQSLGSSLGPLIELGMLKSASEAMKDLAIDPERLYSEWVSSPIVERIQAGYQIKRISNSHSDPVWVVNGYFPYRFSLYQTKSETVPAWLLKNPPGVSVVEARKMLLGDSNSLDSTLRGFLSNHHQRLGVCMDEFNNGFHMSDCDSASIRETAIWFPEQLIEQPLVAELLTSNRSVPREFVSAIVGINASIQFSASTNQDNTRRILRTLVPNPLAQ